MRRHELRQIAARLSGLALIVCVACSDDETAPRPDDASVTSTGAGGSVTTTSSTGTTAATNVGGSAGASASAAGGASDGSATGGSAGSGGATGGVAGGASDGSAGSAGATTGDATDAQAPLAICLRLTGTLSLSFNVTVAFERAMIADCRMKWVTRLYLDVDARAEYQNTVNAWNLDFWGCTGKNTVSEFPLLYTPARISRDEAGLIVQRYLEAANTSLRMSPDETQLMRAGLLALVQPYLDESTEGFPRSLCGDGGGTDGGADVGPAADSDVDAGPGSDAETFDATEWDAAEEEGAPAGEDASPEESGP